MDCGKARRFIVKHLLPTVLMIGAAFGIGYSASSIHKVSAQTSGASMIAGDPSRANWLKLHHEIVEGQGLYISGDEMKNVFGGRADRLDMATMTAMPAYRLNVVVRPYIDPAKLATAQKVSEYHEDKTQIYVILSGTGTQVLGGKPAVDLPEPTGDHEGGSIEGGKSYKVKPGDWVIIPPRTWHQTIPDTPAGVTYGMVHIETRTNIP
jgi:mannose-6-phosphate isomerase-like protein (cupin superfamily)